MKNILSSCFFILLSCFKLEFVIAMESKLFVLPREEFSVSDFSSAMDRLFPSDEAEPKNFVLFIHGRGAGKVKHPDKALSQLLPYIESEYQTKAMLFNWQGSAEGDRLGFPEDKARRAAKDLLTVLNLLAKYKRANSNRLVDVNFSVLTHSMGSIVIEELLTNHYQDLEDDLIDVLFLSAAASKSKRHSHWLKNSSIAKNVIVALNSKDAFLRAAGIALTARRLGKGLKRKEVSPNVSYIDLSKTGVNHRYFISHKEDGGNGQAKNPCVAEIYRSALNGAPVNLSMFKGIKKIKNNGVFQIKRTEGLECK